jgi:uncharacterized protein (TIGR00251 family)
VTLKISKVKGGSILEMYVKPNAKKFKIVVEGDEIVVFCREEPTKGKVNRELIRELSKLFHAKVELVFGFTSKQKKLLINNVKEAEIKQILLRK